MKKSTWKERLFVVANGDGNVTWLCNGNWLVDHELAERIRGLNALLDRKPGTYQNDRWVSEDTPDIKHLLSDRPNRLLTDTGYEISHRATKHHERILVTVEEVPESGCRHVVTINADYAEIIEAAGMEIHQKINGPIWIGTGDEPAAIIMPLNSDGAFVNETLVRTISGKDAIGISI